MENTSPYSHPDELHATSTSNGTEDIQENIEFQIDSDPQVVKALETLRLWRANPDHRSESELVSDVNKARRTAEDKLIGRGKQKEELLQLQTRKHTLETILESINGNEGEDEILQKLGFLDVNGKFTFPDKLFSPLAKELYDKYLELVILWKNANDNSALIGVDVPEMKYLDKARVMAHDQAAQQIYEEMDGTIEFLKVRGLIAKMRDNVVPNAGESQSTALAAKKALEKASMDVYTREEELKNAAA